MSTSNLIKAPPHIVSVSSGLGSAYAWKLLVDEYGPDQVVGVFTDVNGEHPDNYRFLAEVQYELGSRLIKLTNDGKTIWDVMIEQRFLANTRIDVCSRMLKREPFYAWLDAFADRETSTIYLGIDWMEMHRLDKARPRWADMGWTLRAPLAEPPYRAKEEAQQWLDEAGIKRPALYDMGFRHANCGGGCVKAGIGQFRELLQADRRWYIKWWEAGEERVRAHLGKDVAILRDRSRAGVMKHLGLTEADVERVQVGVSVQRDYDDDDAPEFEQPVYEDRVIATRKPLPKVAPLTLRALRERIEVDASAYEDEDEGNGCGVCFLG